MQMNNRVSYIVIGLIVIGLFGGGVYFYQQMFKGIKDPIKVVPDDVGLLIQIPNFTNFVEDWHHNSTYEQALQEMPYLQELSKFVPDLITQLQEKTDNFDLWSHQKVSLSVHPKGFLLLIPTGDVSLQDFKNEILKTGDQSLIFTEKTINNEYYLETEIQSLPILLSEKRGLFIFSNSSELLYQAIENTKKFNKFSSAEHFLALQKVSGKRADAHIFVNYKNLALIVKNKDEALISSVWNHSQQLADWSGLDLNLKPNEILLNGYTILSDSVESFLGIFRNQEAQEMTLPDNFPYATHTYKHLSISNYGNYISAWQSYLEQSQQWEEYSKFEQKIQNSLKQNSNELHQQWWAGEMAVLTTDKGREYAIFSAKKERESFRALAEIAHLSQPKMISMNYKGVKMKEIHFPYFLFTQFGPWFKDFKYTYFAVIDELVVFSHNIKDLKYYIDLLQDGYILSKNQEYHHFSDNLSKQSNFTFYIKHIKEQNDFLQWLPQNLKKKIIKSQLITKQINGFSVQLNWKNNMIYTGVFTSLAGRQQKSSSQWQVHLDSEIIAGPFVVNDHTDDSHKYIVFDDFRQMYLINEQGDIVWKKQLKEKPIGKAYELDYYKNGKIQYLFNTENYIYLIDLTGNTVENYPVSLNSAATAGLSLMDYNHNKDYRILIPTANGKVYNYKKDGSLLKDWKAKNTRKTIVKPIKHVVANSKDYLVAEAANGNIIMFGRKGAIRLEIRKSFSNALGSDIYPNHTNSKGMMVTTDSSGLFIYIPEKGNVKNTDFGAFSPNHFFIYTDFSGNGSEDFIYVDGQNLQVFDRFKKTIINYVFDNEITIKPQIFTIEGRKVLGVLDSKAQQLYLFNSSGLMGNKYQGNSNYVIEKFKGKATVVIIGNGKSLMKYSL